MYDQVNKNDLDNAILFFTSSDDTRGIVIQCAKQEFVPYIKHNIRCVLGTPDRTIGSTVYYDRRPIDIVHLSEDDTEDKSYDEDILFFVDVYEDSKSEIPVSMFYTMKGLGLTPCEVVKYVSSEVISMSDIARGLNEYYQ